MLCSYTVIYASWFAAANPLRTVLLIKLTQFLSQVARNWKTEKTDWNFLTAHAYEMPEHALKYWRYTDYLGLQRRKSDLLEVTRLYTLIWTILNLLIMLEAHYYVKQCLGLLRHLAFGQQPGWGKAICSSQSVQPQGSLSGVQALDLMKFNQIWDVSTQNIWSLYSSAFQWSYIS